MNDPIQDWFDSFRVQTALEARTIELEMMTAERDHLLKVIEHLQMKYPSHISETGMVQGSEGNNTQ